MEINMMKQDAAETVALQALAWLAANEDLMPTFMGSTGASAEDLRTQDGHQRAASAKSYAKDGSEDHDLSQGCGKG